MMPAMDPSELVIAVAFYGLVVGVCLFWIAEEWTRSRGRVRECCASLREALQNATADVLTWCRTFTWRRFVLQLALVCIAVGQRLMDYAQRPATPSGEKLRLSVAREWESPKPKVTAQYIGEHVYVATPGRVVRFKR
jgi:hypothetical protein